MSTIINIVLVLIKSAALQRRGGGGMEGLCTFLGGSVPDHVLSCGNQKSLRPFSRYYTLD